MTQYFKSLTMDIIIQSLGFNLGDTLYSFIKEKVGALKSDHIVRANVTLFLGPENNVQKNYCEILLEVPGNDHFVKRKSEYFETSVSECVDILTQLINKTKTISVHKRHAKTIEIHDAIIESDVDDNDTELEDVVK